MNHYIVKYQMELKKNNRKKLGPDNLRLIWTDANEEFSTLEEAQKYIEYEGYDTYEIYKVELVEAAE